MGREIFLLASSGREAIVYAGRKASKLFLVED
jgi:hypothetical protein